MKIYQIDSSARKDGSTSRALAKKLLDRIKKPEDEIIYRDLNDEMVFVSGLTESGMKIDEKDQNEHHKKMFELSDKLVKELKESDIIIISTPIYNYGPPATLKAWSDLAARVGETFRFREDGRREGLLSNKQVYLVITSGGTKINSKEDFLTPWLVYMLNFFGIKKVDIIAADQMALDYEKSIKQAEEKIYLLTRKDDTLD
jgi:FMN-dependent NADH-azoreductase